MMEHESPDSERVCSWLRLFVPALGPVDEGTDRGFTAPAVTTLVKGA